MDLKKSFELSLLTEFYGKLLTDKQREILIEYFDNNMSLGEISENFSITRQAVLDSLQKAQKSLRKYEDNLKLVKKYLSQKAQVEGMIEDLEKTTFSKENFKKSLNQLLALWEGS